jgi:hypothetical protein
MGEGSNPKSLLLRSIVFFRCRPSQTAFSRPPTKKAAPSGGFLDWSG